MISTSSLEMVSLSRRRWFNATLQEEIESLKTQLSGFMSSIEGRLRDKDADLSTLENNHQVALNSILDEVLFCVDWSVLVLLPQSRMTDAQTRSKSQSRSLLQAFGTPRNSRILYRM